jgi:shikimate kinase
MPRITFIGMPGSGKSAVGQLVAQRLAWPFVDTDKCIEEHQGLTLQALIEQVGEVAFRGIEEQTVLALSVFEPLVIATGGSVVYSEPAMQHLRRLSTVVFLDADIEAIREHIAGQAPRGIIGMTQAGGLEGLLAERLPLYRRYADIVVRCGPDSVAAAAGKVLSELPIHWFEGQ